MKKQEKSHFPSCLIKTGHLPAQSWTDNTQRRIFGKILGSKTMKSTNMIGKKFVEVCG